MNIKQTLTSTAIALAVLASAYCDGPKPALTGKIRGRFAETFEQQEHAPIRTAFTEIAQAEKPAEPATPGLKPRDILQSATDKLKSYASVRANMTQKVTMQSHSFTAKGSYLQGRDLQLRMEFTVELGAQKGSLLEVCDGQVLWSRHDLGEKDQTTITRRDVRQILDAAEKAGQRLKTPDEKQALQAGLVADLGTGGLPALMAGFMKDFDFKKVAEGKIDDRDVLILEGNWNTKYREMWLGTKARDRNPPPLPPHIPDLVRVSLDKETEFPRRFEYFKQNPGQTTPTSLMTVDFTKVIFNGKVGRDDFVFIPPERPQPLDITQLYLQRLAPPTKSEPKKDAAEAGDKPAKKAS